MRITRLVPAVVLVALAWPVLASAETWKDVPLIDHKCAAKFKADPDQHPTSCLLMCAKTGYGIFTADGTWVKLDKKGNEEALAALEKTTKKDAIRVTVTGEKEGDTIKVATLKLD
jgi:hypothetical protein